MGPLEGRIRRASAFPSGERTAECSGCVFVQWDQIAASIVRRRPASGQMKKLLKELRQGERPRASGAGLHATIVAALKRFDDAALAKAAAAFPELVSDGRRVVEPKKLFTEKAVRGFLEAPPNEEVRAAALWTLGQLDSAAALPLAFDVIAQKKPSEHLLAAALHVSARATKAEAQVALDHAARLMQESDSPFVLIGAQTVLLQSRHDAVDATLTKLLDSLDADRGGYVVVAVQRRNRRSVAAALARYAKRTRDHNATQLLAKWK